jgi:CCR4-NOT transcription complex subunit 9
MQQHMFTHQQQYPSEWAQGHHQQAHHHIAQQGQLHPQATSQQAAQAAAIAAAAAQQQHYNRIAGSNGTSMPGNNMIPRGPANDVQATTEVGMTEENKRVLDWIAQLMKPNTRESALLELSKKREQVPELALILWHSFGMDIAIGHVRQLLTRHRCHGVASPGDHFRLSATQPLPVDRCCL